MKVPEAEARLFNRVFVCRRCKSKKRGEPSAFRSRKVICRKCNSRDFRPINKEKKSKG